MWDISELCVNTSPWGLYWKILIGFTDKACPVPHEPTAMYGLLATLMIFLSAKLEAKCLAQVFQQCIRWSDNGDNFGTSVEGYVRLKGRCDKNKYPARVLEAVAFEEIWMVRPRA